MEKEGKDSAGASLDLATVFLIHCPKKLQKQSIKESPKESSQHLQRIFKGISKRIFRESVKESSENLQRIFEGISKRIFRESVKESSENLQKNLQRNL